MYKTSQREVRRGIASKNFEHLKDYKGDEYEKIGYSAGIYGINGLIIRDRQSGIFYATAARNTLCMRYS